MLHKTHIVTRGKRKRRAERLKSRHSNASSKTYSYEQLELNKNNSNDFRVYRLARKIRQNKPATRFVRAAGFAVEEIYVVN